MKYLFIGEDGRLITTGIWRPGMDPFVSFKPNHGDGKRALLEYTKVGYYLLSAGMGIPDAQQRCRGPNTMVLERVVRTEPYGCWPVPEHDPSLVRTNVPKMLAFLMSRMNPRPENWLTIAEIKSMGWI